MTWLDLRADIATEFAGLTRFDSRARDGFCVEYLPPSAYRTPESWVEEYARLKARRRARRVARAAARGPCPRCGGRVERLGPAAKIPVYCSRKCMRAAVWARYAERRRARVA